MRSLGAILTCLSILVVACGNDDATSSPSSTSTGSGGSGTGGAGGRNGQGDGGGAGDAGSGVVQVVLFTHIEDQTPSGALGSQENRDGYLALRAKLIDMAELAQAHVLQWVLQPDWKILEGARLYEDAATTADTGGKNFLLYLRDDLGTIIDPHSHESGGYNYTDVAYLLEQLEVGGSTVIGGHVWDPSLPEFQEWDRFRTAVPGLEYPEASWRGDILIGAGTPQHVNDPLVSGVWRPLDRDHFFTDDPAANIVAVGNWHDEVAGVEELVDLYATAAVSSDAMLTTSWNITPADIMAPSGLATIEQSVLVPIGALCDQGLVNATDFTTLVAAWKADFGGEAFLYQP